MAASPEKIREVIEQYVARVATGTTDEIMELYAEGATVEDPVGTDVRTTVDSIREFYTMLTGLGYRTATLGIVKIAGGGQAAFSFELTVKAEGMTYTVAPIDVMTFDDDGRITSMRAFWGDTDMVVS